MIVTAFKKHSLFQKFAASYNGYWAFGPTRRSAIARVLAQIEAQRLVDALICSIPATA